MNIFHITESFGGGVATAIAAFAVNSTQNKHFLIASVRDSAKIKASFNELFVEIIYVQDFGVKNLFKITKYIKSKGVGYIHLHSSFGGVYGRLLPFSRRNIIYTPHCFAFERTDVNFGIRFVYYLIEYLFSLRSATLAAVSPREQQLGSRMFFSRNIYVPNTNMAHSSIAVERVRNCQSSNEVFTVVTVGRICPQKAPEFFLDTVKLSRRLNLKIKFVWIGDGDEGWRNDLIANEVDVTGWLPHSETIERLNSSDLYFHTAAWEGSPISILEAAALGLPILGRRIPSLESLDVPNLYSSVEECVDSLQKISLKKEILTTMHEMTKIFYKNFSREKQAMALQKVYE